MPKPRIEPRGLGRAEAASYVGVSENKFAELVRDGRMPKPFRVGSRVLWDRQRLDLAFDALAEQGTEMEFVA